MAEADLRQSPLHSLGAALREAGSAHVRLAQVPFPAQIDLRGNPADAAFHAGVAAALGIGPPTAPNSVVVGGDRAILWLGPDQWLVVGPDGSAAATLSSLAAALAAQHVSLVDVSANRVVLELSGPKAREVLMKGCALDLHPRAFGVGNCAQTVISRTGVILHGVALGHDPVYRLYLRPSFAHHLVAWLVDAMAENRAR